ncbi:SMI1/KNR4 family protein [Aeromonas jandaei]|uniref:SMI1/KNR4 family protein n=1 Tax=Aeromonas jandaei TaxID=650 RepID=UPI001C87392B|nr:SMI1/KNR4 family protein [Aeromonas jandaei]
MKMAIKLSLGISMQDVKYIQSIYGLIFPFDYENHLLSVNGVFISANSYCTIPFMKVDDGFIDFQEMYGIKTSNPLLDLNYANQFREEIVGFNRPFIIGADPGGNMFFIECSGVDDSVYYWDRTHLHSGEHAERKETNEEGDVYRLCDNFTSFYKEIMANVGGDATEIKELL